MKKKNNYWIFIVILTAIIGIASYKCSISLELETTKPQSTTSEYSSSSTIVENLTSGFKNFITIGKDFLHTVLNGEESQYKSGWNVLTGKEPVEINDKNDISDGKALAKCSVVKIIDGDTLTADIGNGIVIKIRLIGIDTPESVHSDESKNTIWGDYASEHTKQILSEGQTVWLEYDQQQTDKYGRTLAYVWLSEDTTDISNMLNARILQDGYAMNKVYKPNTKYSSEFEEIRIAAMKSNKGLWAYEGFQNLWEY